MSAPKLDNPLDAYSTTHIMRRCGRLGIPFEVVMDSPYFVDNPDRRPKVLQKYRDEARKYPPNAIPAQFRNSRQYHDGVIREKGGATKGDPPQKLTEDDMAPFSKEEMYRYLGLDMPHAKDRK